MNGIVPLSWDSEFFGMRVGKLELASGIDAAEIKQLLLCSPFRVVVVRIENPTDRDREAMSPIASLIDNRLVYAKDAGESVVPESSSFCVKYEGPLTRQITELAWASGEYSRFYQDPGFRPYFKRLYHAWIEGSIDGRLADAVFVRSVDDKPAGLVTVRKVEREAEIGLLAVERECRRMGIGDSLIRCVEGWCAHSHCGRLRVATQARNRPACVFYEKQGFRCERCYGTYHFWKE